MAAHGPAGPTGSGQGLLSSSSDRQATPEEERLVASLRQELSADLATVPQFPEVVGDLRLLRTLRAFDHCVAEAAAAFRQHLAIRRARLLDTVREDIASRWGSRLWQLRCQDLPHGEEICSYMPEVLVLARARTGDPISLGLWGRGRPATFVQEVENWQEKFLEYFCYVSEARMMLLDQVSREQNRLAHFVQVFDLEDWSMMANTDRLWTTFTTEQAGPIGETYHDCNTTFLAIRVTRWARMAYNIVKPMLPKKVTEKVHIYSGDFPRGKTMVSLVDAATLDRLVRRNFEPTGSCHEGQTTIRPRQRFELQVDLPAGSSLSWRFGVESSGNWRHACLWGGTQLWTPELLFSISARGEEDIVPQRPVGENASGRIEYPADARCGVRTVTVRWDNSQALVTSRTLSYRIEVETPEDSASELASAVRPVAKPGASAWWTWCVLVLACLLLCAVFGAQADLRRSSRIGEGLPIGAGSSD